MASRRRAICSPAAPAIWILGALLASPSLARAQSAYVRVNQVGYEAGNTPFRAYLMSAAPGDGATFRVINSEGKTVYSSHVGSLLGIWSNSRKLNCQVYALDFKGTGRDMYSISVAGPLPALSPTFAVDEPDVLY